MIISPKKTCIRSCGQEEDDIAEPAKTIYRSRSEGSSRWDSVHTMITFLHETNPAHNTKGEDVEAVNNWVPGDEL